mmetsp:Transcript_141523/g.359455  ORF Transcript_141523/g.359455 Transcript_141523/m.359455 type:complete len:231 (+) Transcript_141523:845-1537(+)
MKTTVNKYMISNSKMPDQKKDKKEFATQQTIIRKSRKNEIIRIIRNVRINLANLMTRMELKFDPSANSSTTWVATNTVSRKFHLISSPRRNSKRYAAIRTNNSIMKHVEKTLERVRYISGIGCGGVSKANFVSASTSIPTKIVFIITKAALRHLKNLPSTNAWRRPLGLICCTATPLWCLWCTLNVKPLFSVVFTKRLKNGLSETSHAGIIVLRFTAFFKTCSRVCFSCW